MMSETTKGRAAILQGAGQPMLVDEVAFGAPGSGEVLVRLVASGLCHTDLGVLAGGIPFPAPGIIGHEGAGIVEAVGSNVDLDIAPGDKVLLSFTSCGDCAACAEKHPAYCTTWLPRNLLGELRAADSAQVTRGDESIAVHFFGQSSFAEYAIADARSIVPVPADADLTVLAPLGCAVVTGFGSVWNALDVQEDDLVAVYGTGAVGLSGVIAAGLRKPRQLIAIDMVPERLELAKELGATDVIDARDGNVTERIAAITSGHGVDKSFDTTGNPGVARSALDAAAIRGTVLVCGAPPPGTEIPVDIQGILTGKVLRGITMGDSSPLELIPKLVELHAQGKLPLERLQRRYRIDEIQQAADDMHHGVTVKPVIVFDDTESV